MTYIIETKENIRECITWCKQNISTHGGYINDHQLLSGPDGWEAMGRWRVYDGWSATTFYFKNQEDAALFKLRWG